MAFDALAGGDFRVRETTTRRYLFVVPPFPSHIYPTVTIAHELEQRGHAVGWVTHEPMRRFLPATAWVYSLATPTTAEALAALQRDAGAPWLAGMKVLFERVLMPLAHDMLPGVEAAIAAFHPDVLIVDQQTFAGALAARRAGLQWVTSSPSAALHTHDLANFPNVREWLRSLHDQLQRDAGLDPVLAPECSPWLVLLYTSHRLVGLEMPFPPHYRLVGPLLGPRPAAVDFPWSKLGTQRRVLITLGTLWADRGERFFRMVVEALADAPLQVIVHAPAGFIATPPSNFIVRTWVPLPELYPHLDAVVTHAGTTLTEVLLHGLPAVVAPIAHEQATFAQQAVKAGAARRVRFNRVNAVELREAVFDILDQPSYKAAAQIIGASFRDAGGVRVAVDAIEAIA